MTSSFTPSHALVSNSRVKVVQSFEELVSTRFGQGINALCWQRTLSGNFEEVVEHVTARENDIDTLDDAT
jgi:hypothetical protein